MRVLDRARSCNHRFAPAIGTTVAVEGRASRGSGGDLRISEIGEGVYALLPTDAALEEAQATITLPERYRGYRWQDGLAGNVARVFEELRGGR